jgi:hypothetical protein
MNGNLKFIPKKRTWSLKPCSRMQMHRPLDVTVHRHNILLLLMERSGCLGDTKVKKTESLPSRNLRGNEIWDSIATKQGEHDCGEVSGAKESAFFTLFIFVHFKGFHYDIFIHICDVL